MCKAAFQLSPSFPRRRHLDRLPPDREHHRVRGFRKRQNHQAMEKRLLSSCFGILWAIQLVFFFPFCFVVRKEDIFFFFLTELLCDAEGMRPVNHVQFPRAHIRGHITLLMWSWRLFFLDAVFWCFSIFDTALNFPPRCYSSVPTRVHLWSLWIMLSLFGLFNDLIICVLPFIFE